jgi:serine/threonine-protein kinase
MMFDQTFPPRPGTVIDDKFVVTELIGTGGMGVVLAARHRALGNMVAIKLLHPEHAASSDVVARFLREARATGHLKSEHVVGIVDVGTLPSGVPYFVMEHLTGIDLATLLAEHGPLPIDDVLDYVLQALEAIAEAHRNGIVHRDLKPANLLLTTREDDSAFVKVLDFGTSKLRSTELTLDRMLTRSGTLLGSPLYMSPEQIRDAASADARSDIWSIGVLMHELLTGHAPFQGRFLAEIIGAICEDDYAAPAREDLPFELCEILRRCLQKEPSARYQSVEELAQAFLPIITTVASQVSIERILRLPSSAPPRPDPLDFAALSAYATPPHGMTRSTSSVAPHERDARDSVPPNANRGLAVQLGLAVLAAAGTLTWLNLRSQPAQVDVPRAPIAAQAPEPAVTITALVAPSEAAAASANKHERGRAAGATSARSRAKQKTGTLGPAAIATPGVGLGARPSVEPSPAKRERALDHQNPFAD